MVWSGPSFGEGGVRIPLLQPLFCNPKKSSSRTKTNLTNPSKKNCCTRFDRRKSKYSRMAQNPRTPTATFSVWEVESLTLTFKAKTRPPPPSKLNTHQASLEQPTPIFQPHRQKIPLAPSVQNEKVDLNIGTPGKPGRCGGQDSTPPGWVGGGGVTINRVLVFRCSPAPGGQKCISPCLLTPPSPPPQCHLP